jgi:hypothetical protein
MVWQNAIWHDIIWVWLGHVALDVKMICSTKINYKAVEISKVARGMMFPFSGKPSDLRKRFQIWNFTNRTHHMDNVWKYTYSAIPEILSDWVRTKIIELLCNWTSYCCCPVLRNTIWHDIIGLWLGHTGIDAKMIYSAKTDYKIVTSTQNRSGDDAPIFRENCLIYLSARRISKKTKLLVSGSFFRNTHLASPEETISIISISKSTKLNFLLLLDSSC